MASDSKKLRVAVPRGVAEPKEFNVLDRLTFPKRPEQSQSVSVGVSNLAAPHVLALFPPPSAPSRRALATTTTISRPLLDGVGQVGYRAGMIAHAATAISDPVESERLCAAMLAAPTDDAAATMANTAYRRERARLEQVLKPQTGELTRLNRVLGAAEDVENWLKETIVLGSATTSIFHRVTDENVIMMTRENWPLPAEVKEAQTGPAGVFLVQHNWAELLAGSDVDEGGYRLPYDRNVFEFEVSGRRLIALVCCADGIPYRLIPIIRAKGGWLIPGSYGVAGELLTPEGEDARDDDPALALVLMAHIRAIAITLDAEVVRSEVVRASAAEVNQRARKGLGGPLDYHVLSLVRRVRSAPALAGHASGHRKRLHFRRGHWRHYTQHKTWIRWCLVGDPSLGFADKDYRL